MRSNVYARTLQAATLSHMDPNEPRELHVIVGERLKAARKDAGVRQEDVAAAANRFGLSWGRSSVAALEAGTRKLSIEEFSLLRGILPTVGIWIELIRDSDLILLTPELSIWGRGFRRSFLDTNDQMALNRDLAVRKHDRIPEGQSDLGIHDFKIAEELDPPERLEHARITMGLMAGWDLGDKVWPQLGWRGGGKATEGQRSELERKVADRLKTDPQIIAVMSAALWGQSVTEERDRRTAERGDFESKRALQSARGHVTRDLIEELEKEWADKRDAVRNYFDGLSKIYMSDDFEEIEDWIERTNRRWNRKRRSRVTGKVYGED